MKKERERERERERDNSREHYPNLTGEELRRDIVNLHLEEPDLIMDSKEELEAYLQKLYGKNYMDGLDLT